MSKNQTPWSNNDIKPSTAWVNNDVKPLSSWTDNDVKNTAIYTEVTKNDTAWQSTVASLESWLYDSASQKYDDTPVRGYDYLVPQTNQLNTKNPTAWSQVV